MLRQLGEFGGVEQPQWQLAPGNINLEFYASEAPVEMFPFANTSFFDVIGNVWQHTLTPQHPFDGFQAHAIYNDFTVPCFGRDHNTIKGCSWVSTGNEAITRSRYQFRRHVFQHAGIRYVASQRDLSCLAHLAEHNPYDDDAKIARMTHAHYADDALFGVANWPQRVAQLAIAKSSRFDKALDMGCAACRSAFELATPFARDGRRLYGAPHRRGLRGGAARGGAARGGAARGGAARAGRRGGGAAQSGGATPSTT